MLLEVWGHEPVMAESVASGIEALQEQDGLQAVISDYQLRDGTARDIVVRNEFQRVPLRIVMTAEPRETLPMFVQDAVNAVLQKSGSPRALLELLNRVPPAARSV